MNCNAVKNVLDLFSEGRLTPGRLAQIKEHLSVCPSCAKEALAFARLRASSKIAAPAALKARLATILAAPPALEPQRERFFESGLPAFAGAAAYAVLVLALNLVGPGVSSQKFDSNSPAGDYQ